MLNNGNSLKPIVFALIMITVIISLIIYSVIQFEFFAKIENFIFLSLSIIVKFMNIIGVFTIVFGGVLVSLRFIREKIKTTTNVFTAFSSRLTFLTLGLDILIGAEIINIAIMRTLEDFNFLTLTILMRVLIWVILYFEKKWDSTKV